MSMPPYYRNAPETSREAAESMVNAAPRERAKVENAILNADLNGLADFEGQARLGMPPNCYTPRRGELVKAGAVIDSGKRRITPSGRRAVVWIHARFAGEVTR